MQKGQGVYAHNDVPDVTQTYQDSVLVKNWYEERFQTEVASASGREQPTKERVIHQALPDGHPGLWETTKNATDLHMRTSPPPVGFQSGLSGCTLPKLTLYLLKSTGYDQEAQHVPRWKFTGPAKHVRSR